ncbi:hypothetical protein [Nannocystis pusilla]|uniref:hypothetical protein n=1 Tax=Nannocystis pusilla TaxID=889268 RepID=UPI003B76241C
MAIDEGGISTFNRLFCEAAAQYGVRTICSLPTVSEEERTLAKAVRVELLTHSESLTLLRQEGSRALVVGHGRIHGPKARELADLSGARRVHFLHMSPEAIEPKKGKAEAEALTKASERRNVETELARTAELAAGVGPRLAADLELFVRPWRTDEVHTFYPGLVDRLAVLPALSPREKGFSA